MVFSKSYCPYCDSAKSALKKMGVDFKPIELDQIDEGSEMQAYLAQITGQRTVPNIFIRGEF
jgi:glutaredoxin 3